MFPRTPTSLNRHIVEIGRIYIFSFVCGQWGSVGGGRGADMAIRCLC